MARNAITPDQAEDIKDRIADLVRSAETGEQWAEITRLEAVMLGQIAPLAGGSVMDVKQIRELDFFLADLEDFFDGRADADCDQDGYVPNDEMRWLQRVREFRSALQVQRTEEVERQIKEAISCFDAAECEGLSTVLAETNDERLADLVQRRLLMRRSIVQLLSRLFRTSPPKPHHPRAATAAPSSPMTGDREMARSSAVKTARKKRQRAKAEAQFRLGLAKYADLGLNPKYMHSTARCAAADQGISAASWLKSAKAWDRANGVPAKIAA